MSYILDALKKIEHEKNKKTGPAGRISISGDLFQERNRAQGKAGAWRIMLLVVVVSVLTVAVTWFFFAGHERNGAVVNGPASLPAAAPVTPPAVAPVDLQPVQTQPAPPSAPPASLNAAVPVPPKNVEAAEDEEPSPRDVRRSKKHIKAQPPSPLPKQAVTTVQPPADIKLSGIAWQDERAGRRAVINGFLLKEGAVVSGARIALIQADRVRFTSAAGQFEIKLDSVLPPDVKR